MHRHRHPPVTVEHVYTKSSLLLAVLLLGLTASGRAETAAETLPRPDADAADMVGALECIECHEHAGSIWEATPHAATFMEMPRSKEGRAIAKRMGIRRIKQENLCLSCHATTALREEKPKAISGVSCESCHAPAREWIARHSEFSGKEEGEESPSEVEARWADAEAAGMLRPHATLELARNCIGCHVVADEELVNRGEHTAGSDFELVAWSQGVIRHNVEASKGKRNDVAPPERQRVLYVVGTLAELETRLRAVAKARQKADYAIANARRVAALRERLAGIAEAAPTPEILAAHEAIDGLRLSLSNQAAIDAAAVRIGDAAVRFSAAHESPAATDLGGIQALLPSAEQYQGAKPTISPVEGSP